MAGDGAGAEMSKTSEAGADSATLYIRPPHGNETTRAEPLPTWRILYAYFQILSQVSEPVLGLHYH